MQFRLTNDRFPPGTTVGVYPQSEWPGGGAPLGSQGPRATAVDSQTTDARGVATFSGLDADTVYWAAAQVSGSWRWVRIHTAPSQRAYYQTDDPEDTAFEIDVPAGQIEDIYRINIGGVPAMRVDGDGILHLLGVSAPDPFVLAERMPINVMDYPYLVQGDGTNELAAIQQAIDDAGVGGRVYFPKPPSFYGIAGGSILIEHEGVELIGPGWEKGQIKQLDDDLPIIRFASYLFLHSCAIVGLRLTFANQQATGSDGYCIAFDGPAGANYFYNRFERLKMEKCAVGIGVLGSAGGVHPVWNCYFDQLYFTEVKDSLIDLYQPVSTGVPVNTLRQITCLNGGVVPTDAALKLYGEWTLDGFDLEDWTGKAIYADSGFGRARGVHLERHTPGSAGDRICYFANGEYKVDGIDVEMIGNLNASMFFMDVQGSLEVNGFLGNRGSGTGTYQVLDCLDDPANIKLTLANTRYITAGWSDYNIPLGAAGLKCLRTVDGLPPAWDPFAALPTPSADYRGRQYRIVESGTDADYVVVCLRQADGSYEWVRLDEQEQPYCRLSRSSNTSIPHDTNTAVPFNTEIEDAFAMHVANDTKITVPVGGDGLYAMSASLPFAFNITGRRTAQIKLNGATILGSDSKQAVQETGQTTDCMVATQRRLVAGDYIEVIAYQNSGGALNVSAFQEQCHLTLTRMGR